MSVSPIITLGYGSTFGLPALIITLGYGLGSTPPVPPVPVSIPGPGDGDRDRIYNQLYDSALRFLLLSE